MSIYNLIWLSLVFGLPFLVSVRIFRNEPADRYFWATWALAVLGSGFTFTAASIVLFLIGIGTGGMFDGLLAIVVSIHVALIVGVILRVKRAHVLPLPSSENSHHAPNQ